MAEQGFFSYGKDLALSDEWDPGVINFFSPKNLQWLVLFYLRFGFWSRCLRPLDSGFTEKSKTGLGFSSGFSSLNLFWSPLTLVLILHKELD